MELIASGEITAAYVSAAIAALAIVGSLITTWLTLRHQRVLAQDERLWTRRADTYVLFLQHQRDDPDFSELLPAELASQLIAYGSEEVNAALAVVRQSRGLGKESFGAAMDALVGQMRFELQRKPDKDRLHVTTRWQD